MAKAPSETPEKIDEKKQQATLDSFEKYAIDELKKDKTKIDEIFTNEGLSDTIQKEIEKLYAKYKIKHKNFTIPLEEVKKNITPNTLKARLAAPYMDIEKKRKTLREHFHYDFDFTDAHSKTLDKAIKKLEEKRVNELINKPKERNDYLRKIGLFAAARKAESVKLFLANLVKSAPDTINDADKKIIMQLVKPDGTLKYLEDPFIIEEIFKLSFLTNAQKKQIVEKFLPSISLEELQESGLLGAGTSSAVSKIKKQVETELIADFDYIDSKNAAEVMSYLSDDEIYADTASLFADVADVKSLDFSKIAGMEKFREEFFHDYNESLDAEETKEAREEFPDGYKDFTDKLAKQANFGDVKKFKRGNYLMLSVERQLGTSRKTEQNKVFLKIADNGDNNSYSVKLIDAGFGELNIDSKTTLKASYDKFLDIFENGLKLNNLHYTVKTSQIFTGEEMQRLTESGEIPVAHETTSKTEKNRLTKVKDAEENLIAIRDEIQDLFYKDVPAVQVFSYEIEKQLEEYEKETDETEREKIMQKISELREQRTATIGEIEKAYDKALSRSIDGTPKHILDEIAVAELEHENNPSLESQARLKELYEAKDTLKENLKTISEDLRLPVKAEEKYLELTEAWYREASIELLELTKFDLAYLREVLDEIDSGGKDFGLEKGTVFVAKNGAIFTIENNPEAEEKLVIANPFTPSAEIGLSDYEFFYEVFEKEGCKRVSKEIADKNTFLTALKQDTDTSGIFDDMTFNDKGHLTKENTDNNIIYEYLQADDNELVKILSINENEAHVEFAFFGKDEEELKDAKDHKEVEKKILTYPNSQTTVPLSWLYAWAKDNKAKPFTSSKKYDHEKEGDGKELKKSLISGIMNSKSIGEMIAGLKMGVDMIGETLKEGTDERSAQFAQSVYGKVLPEQVALDLQSRVEYKAKERSEHYVERLGTLNTPEAMRMLRKWITTKNSPEYLKEAAVIYMAKKYGYLNAKENNPDLLGTYTWYKMLGGVVGSEHFNKIKAKHESNPDENGNFTEEALVLDLINNQCKRKMKPYRRGKLYKQLVPLFKEGLKKEYDDGVGEGTDAKNIKETNGMAMGELIANVPDHARGLIEKGFDKGGSMKDLNKIPFIMAFSGMAYSFNTETLNGFKVFTTKSKLTPILNFIEKKGNLDLLNKTILEIAKHMQANDAHLSGNYSRVGNEAQEIYDSMRSYPRDHEKMLKKVETFYDNYGDDITRALYKLNTGKTDGNSYLGDLLEMEEENNETFKQYNAQMKAFGEGFFSWEDKDMMTDTFPGLGSTGMDEVKSAAQLFEHVQRGFKHDYAIKYFQEFTQELEAIKNRSYPVPEAESQALKKKLIAKKLKNLFGGVFLKNSDIMLSDILFGNSSFIAKFGRDNGLDFSQIISSTSGEILDGTKDRVFNGYAENLLAGSKNRSKEYGDNFDTIEEDILSNVDEALKNKYDLPKK